MINWKFWLYQLQLVTFDLLSIEPPCKSEMFDAILTIFYENDPIISKYFVEEKNDGHT